MADELVGRVLDGRYEIVEPLAIGGMATVYRGRQLNVDRAVAIKVMLPEDRGDDKLVARFESEAKIISRLNHPNTLKLIDYGATTDGLLYLVTELLEGRPLSKVIRDEGPLPWRRVLGLMRDVCRSLAEAHAVGVVHRDLKPANIFLQDVMAQEVVKVLDFGVAKVTPGQKIEPRKGPGATPPTMAGVVLGTPAYLSPEQAFAKPLDGRADLYSLAVVAFHCLTGEVPFGGEPIAQIAGHGLETPPRPSQVGARPDLPSDVEALILRLLDKEPENRGPSAAALAGEIEAMLEDREEHRGPSPLLWLAPILAAAAAVAAYVALEPRVETPPIERIARDGGTQVDAVSSDQLDGTETGTTTSVEIFRDAGVQEGLRVIAIEGAEGFADAEALDFAVRTAAPKFFECHETTQRGEDEGRRLALTFDVNASGTSLSVAPRDANAERFRRCVAIALSSPIRWPGRGRVRVLVGDR
ncbi:MAG: serine/threonine-protein kinase [Deltaproteobacteria bacterium]|jgi:hypothetical protein